MEKPQAPKLVKLLIEADDDRKGVLCSYLMDIQLYCDYLESEIQLLEERNWKLKNMEKESLSYTRPRVIVFTTTVTNEEGEYIVSLERYAAQSEKEITKLRKYCDTLYQSLVRFRADILTEEEINGKAK